ncbi:mitochondrial ribosomal protein L37-domain-containing protein [Dimargaris cristalligena]|uniref:Large ribosomal subunit protein mL54 n=1 Tax=Dimargaris cristalligena TaxID=215637 RepID=A0A4P9ZWS7_9FUNG|nr:mitochondrial ribosomal protein L37-domain-containing protein [Dimargaris cristalligena]|eukprot:RKP38126.1 mitochondrial ribosomal protein L37-domain-containing protein [Dimargaris cristalligena]
MVVAAPEKKPHPVSITPEGTVLKGLNFSIDKKDPVAKKDEEYPEWLWTLLDDIPRDQLPDRVRLRKINKEGIKNANFMRKKK